MNRRDLLTLLAALGAGPLLTRIAEAAAVATSASPKVSIFSETQRRTVALLADLILPPTDTPGASAAGVPGFIEQAVGQWYTPAERKAFLDGLSELDQSCRTRFGKSFEQCGEQQRIAVLTTADEQARAYQGAGRAFDSLADDAPFFLRLKQLTVVGYYTSESGATQELSYNPVPNRYDGDIDFTAAGGRQWSF